MFRILVSSCERPNKLCFYRHLKKGTIVRHCTNRAEKNNSEEESNDAISELYSDALVEEEEIELKRNKNRLPEPVYKKFIKKEPMQPIMKIDFTRNRMRLFYGKYGKGCGLRPGVMWPTREELEDMQEYDTFAHPSIKESLNKIAKEEAELQQSRQEYEEQVEKNLTQMDKMVQDHYGRIAKQEAEVEALKKKRADLVEEISEYLGYDVDPADPKFKEALEQREKEKKKKIKEKKQQESYNKMLQKLAEIAEKKN